MTMKNGHNLNNFYRNVWNLPGEVVKSEATVTSHSATYIVRSASHSCLVTSTILQHMVFVYLIDT